MDFTAIIIPLILAIVLHEVAHGWTAYLLGDKTAYRANRLTLNPVAHIDKVGSILVPTLLYFSHIGILFGWAKPVPVQFSALKRPIRDMGLVAIAGPVTNVLLAGLCYLVLLCVNSDFWSSSAAALWVGKNLSYGILINLALCAFNLIPILPLDGGRIVVALLPTKWAFAFWKTERYGLIILLIILLIIPLTAQAFGYNFDIIRSYMTWMLGDALHFVQTTL